MRYAGAFVLAAGFGAITLVLAIGAGGPCEDGTAADFRTVACAEDPGGLEVVRVGLFVAAPLLMLGGGLVAAARELRWPLVAGGAEATLALVAAVYVGTLDAPEAPASQVESITVSPRSCAPVRCRLEARLTLDAPSPVVVGIRPPAGGVPPPLTVRGPDGRRAAEVPDGYRIRVMGGTTVLRVTSGRRLAPGTHLLLVQPESGETAEAQFTVSR